MEIHSRFVADWEDGNCIHWGYFWMGFLGVIRLFVDRELLGNCCCLHFVIAVVGAALGKVAADLVTPLYSDADCWERY